MPVTTIANMQIVPEKFSQYVIDRTTELNTFVNSGIAAPDATVAALINGTPEGGRSFTHEDSLGIPMQNIRTAYIILTMQCLQLLKTGRLLLIIRKYRLLVCVISLVN